MSSMHTILGLQDKIYTISKTNIACFVIFKYEIENLFEFITIFVAHERLWYMKAEYYISIPFDVKIS